MTPPTAFASDICTFSDWAWNSSSGRAENFREVEMPRAELLPEQRHSELPCSICREDQVRIGVGKHSALICKAIAGDVEEALRRTEETGFIINSLTGYRVGRTKGPLDARGLRTQYSHHSFGLAIDINAAQNGLYDRCIEFGPHCRLRRGGPWVLGDAGTISPQTPLYQEMRRAGLKWGGELKGRQKDFMHFSLQGD
ncbi:MAG: M15 family metallopeptidase [Hellea sp.]